MHQAQGKTMEDYIATHQDRSRNALNKSTEAAFLSWQEDLRADQSQYISDRIVNLGFWVFSFYFFPSKITQRFDLFQVYASLQPLLKTILRAEKEGEKTRTKLVRQLEDWFVKLFFGFCFPLNSLIKWTSFRMYCVHCRPPGVPWASLEQRCWVHWLELENVQLLQDDGCRTCLDAICQVMGTPTSHGVWQWHWGYLHCDGMQLSHCRNSYKPSEEFHYQLRDKPGGRLPNECLLSAGSPQSGRAVRRKDTGGGVCLVIKPGILHILYKMLNI